MADRLAALGEPVRPHPWCRWAWRAWHRLKDDRPWRAGGMGPAAPGGIPYTAVAGYADRHGQDADALHTLIQAMDGVYLDWWAEKADAAARKDGG